MVKSEEKLKSLLVKVKEESEKTGFKPNIQKLRSWHLVPSLHGKLLLFSRSVVSSSLWPYGCHVSLSFTISWSLLKLMVMPLKHLVLSHLLLLPPSVFLNFRVFSNESCPHIRWPEHWSFSFSISPSNEYSGLIFFMIDWFDLLVDQGTLKSSPTPYFKSINS